MSGMNERDKAYVPWRAWDKISPGGGISTQPWLGQVRKVVLSEHRISICKGEKGETSTKAGCVDGKEP